MSKFIYSLQLRLIAGFVVVLGLSLFTVGWAVSQAAAQESERYRQELEESRAARVAQFVSLSYVEGSELFEVQPAIEQVGTLFNSRIIVNDPSGQPVADSLKLIHGLPGSSFEAALPATASIHVSGSGLAECGVATTMPVTPDAWVVGPGVATTTLPSTFAVSTVDVTLGTANYAPIVTSAGGIIGSVSVEPIDIPGVVQEPQISRVVAATNRSLTWAGGAAALAGMMLVALMSRRMLTPVRVLSTAAERLGKGNLSARVDVQGRDEIGRLATSFNSMATALQQAEHNRRNLMADVAHELRTPLSNVQGYVEAMRAGLLKPDAATLDTVHHQVVQLGHLVEDLRFLALAEAGALRLDRSATSLTEVVEDTVNGFVPRAEAKFVNVSFDSQNDLPHVEIDRNRIAQVVSNLMENAITHTPADGSVKVTVEKAPNARVRVSVEDTGIGISQDELGLVFDRFYRADPSRARATGGAGLGLTIARQIVEAHGGTIRAESAPGKGSTFTFELPVQVGR